MKKKRCKLFIVRKYVWATDAKDAIRKESNQKADDVWVDDEYKKQLPDAQGIGFYTNDNEK